MAEEIPAKVVERATRFAELLRAQIQAGIKHGEMAAIFEDVREAGFNLGVKVDLVILPRRGGAKKCRTRAKAKKAAPLKAKLTKKDGDFLRSIGISPGSLPEPGPG